MQPQVATQASSAAEDTRAQLAADLRSCYEREQAEWDEQVAGDDATGADLWESMPVVDSKTVARMAPIFQRHEGRPFDLRRIRAGGYSSIEDAIDHLVHGQ